MSDPNGTAVGSGWGTALHVFYCDACHSAHLAPEDVTLAACPACSTPGLASQPERLRREPPELVIPFAVGQEEVSASLAAWCQGGWFRPDERDPDVLLRRLQHTYLPMWLVDADVSAAWEAEMGYDYQAASFRERYQDGRWVSQEVTETRTRWEPRLGRLQRHYDNVVVPALEDHDLLMARTGGYDLRARKGYSPRAIAGSAVRIPDQGPEAAWPDAERVLQGAAEDECRVAGAADHGRNWRAQAEYGHANWTQMLAPLYVTFYQEGERRYPVWINGQSGRVFGVKVLSQRKANTASLVLGAVAALLLLLAAVIGLVGAVLVAPLAVAVLVGVIALLLGLAAPVPALWAWASNRRAGEGK